MTVQQQKRCVTWRDLPAGTVVNLLQHLKAGDIYRPQDFRAEVSVVAFASCSSDETLVSAVEGLELAMVIADQLAWSYSVYTDDDLTLNQIRVAADQWLRARGQEVALGRRHGLKPVETPRFMHRSH